VLGDFALPRFPRVKQAVLALLERLGPADQVAMLSASGREQYQVEFTTDRERVARALEKPAPAGRGAGDRILLDVLRRTADALEPLAGRRKVVVLVSEN